MSFVPTPINPATSQSGPSPFIAFTQRVIPATFDESMSYQEALFALLKFLKDEVVKVINENGAITDQQTAVINQLTEYVNNYFDNLDVQDEINNKLDQMAESGQLADIISTYLRSNAIMAYNTVADLEQAENVVAGSFARIYGKDVYNDGKGAFYKIRNIKNTDVIDGDNLVALPDDTLVAEKMPDFAINQINQSIDNLTQNEAELEDLINTKNGGYRPNLMRDCIFDLPTNGYTQGSCVIGNKVYIAQPTSNNNGNLVILNIANKSYEGTITDIPMYHAGDLCAVGTKIYMSPWNATAGKILNVYDTATNTSSVVSPFSNVTTTKTTIGGIATFDDTKIICILTTTNMPNESVVDSEYWLYDTVTGNVTQLTLENTDNVYFSGSIYALQGTACTGNHYYLNTSLDNNLMDFIVDTENNKLIFNSVLNMPYYDNSGLLIGEYEGLSNAESVFGEGALYVTSHVIDNVITNTRTVKTYVVNPKHNTPNFEFKSNQDVVEENGRMLIYVNPIAPSLYEDGTPSYPYKSLARGIACSQSKNMRAQHVEVIIQSSSKQTLYAGNIYEASNVVIGVADTYGHDIWVNRILHSKVEIGGNYDASPNSLPTVHFTNFNGAQIIDSDVLLAEVHIHVHSTTTNGLSLYRSLWREEFIQSVTCDGNQYLGVGRDSVAYNACAKANVTFNGGGTLLRMYRLQRSSKLFIGSSDITTNDVGALNSGKIVDASLTSCGIYFPYQHS